MTLIEHRQEGPYTAKQVGFYSTGNPFEIRALFGGPGEVLSEFSQQGSEEFEARHSLVLWLDRAQIMAADGVIDQWRAGKKSYVLFESDCISMMHEVATAFGLRAPRRFAIIAPDKYLQALIEMNVEAWVRTTAALTEG